jgi:subtilisin family serine protease
VAIRSISRAQTQVTLVCAALALALPQGAAATDDGLASTQRVFDGGAVAEFEVAADELHRLHGGSQALVSFAPLASAELVRQYALWLKKTKQEDTELTLYERGRPRTEWSRRYLTREVIVRLAPAADAHALAARAQTALVRVSDLLPGWFSAQAQEVAGALALAGRLRQDKEVLWAEPQLARLRQKKLIPNDTFFPQQWHLRNTGQNGGVAGIDLNVTNVWDTYQGAGVVIAIVDDGLQYTHPDLAANYIASLSYNFNDGNPDPAPETATDLHGTPVAGLAGARGNNGFGVSGVAPQTSLAGLRLLGAPTTDAQEAAAVLFQPDAIWVKNNSWGAPDGTGELLGPGPLMVNAMRTAATTGRGGQGTVFVFAAGNGLAAGDNVNYDGYANSLYAIAVTAVTDQGHQAPYAEPGACLVVAAPSSSSAPFCSGGRQAMATTDLTGTDGLNTGAAFCELPDASYTQQFGGTSASAPLVSGLAALLLQANPRLSYRDITEILLRSATRVEPSDSDWWTNSAGVPHNHKFGAGLANAEAAITLAKQWANLGPMQTLAVLQTNLALPIPDNNSSGVLLDFVITNSEFRVERAALTVTAPHPRYGDLAITLISPAGTSSRLAEVRNSVGAGYQEWTLTTVRHWGEHAKGVWRVRVADMVPGQLGTLQALELQIQGSTPQAALTISPIRASLQIQVNAAAPGWIYYGLGSTNLQSWSPLTTLLINNQGTATYVDIHPAPLGRFYRAQAAPE